MLAFVDQSANIKVFRIHQNAEGQVTRERLGVVRKKDYSLDEQLSAAVPAEEKASIAEMIEFYKKGADHAVLAALYSIPESLRKVTDYAVHHGSDLERRMLAMALMESLKHLRKADREEGRSS